MKIPIHPVPHNRHSLAPRGLELAKNGEIMNFFNSILTDPYHPDTNPDGFVNIGTSENVCLSPRTGMFLTQR